MDLPASAPSVAVSRLREPGGMEESGGPLAELMLDPKKEPRPLLFGPGRHGVIWSAKSACTTVLLWYLWQCDLLQAALFYNRWPHRFRNSVLLRSATYRTWANEVDVKSWSWLRVIRDPSKRAVSSYRHALKFGYANEAMSESLRRPVDHRDGFSFELFLDHLARINIATCNIHYRLQVHPIEERVAVTRVVNIDREDLVATLRETSLGPNKPREPVDTLLAAIAQISGFHHARTAEAERDHSATRFSCSDAWREWPSTESFISATTREKIEAIYAKDFACYADHI